MALGVLYALAAGLLWGLVFVSPLWLPDHPAALLSFGRYLAFGLIALPLAWFDRRALRRLSLADWGRALELAAIGNLLYYLCLAAAIQRIGVPLPTLIIGTLPVVITLVAAWRGDSRVSWPRLLPSLLLIAAGLITVHRLEVGAGVVADPDAATPWVGVLLATIGVLCWTWYPLRNADWLKAHPTSPPRAWATAQGLATLPLALSGMAVLTLVMHARADPFPMPFGPEPIRFVGIMLGMGLLASWLGTLCWNAASRRLPAALAGQLIVFETLAALLYAFILRGAWPSAQVLAGIVMLIAGVLFAVRAQSAATRRASAAGASAD